MNENIQLIRFDGLWIVSEIEQIPDVEFGDPDCMLKFPYEIEGNCLGMFPLNSSEREFVIRSSNISLITAPSVFVYNQYMELITKEKLISVDEQFEE